MKLIVDMNEHEQLVQKSCKDFILRGQPEQKKTRVFGGYWLKRNLYKTKDVIGEELMANSGPACQA